MRKDVMMISAGLMMLAMASCDQTEYREITEDRVVPQIRAIPAAKSSLLIVFFMFCCNKKAPQAFVYARSALCHVCFDLLFRASLFQQILGEFFFRLL